MSNTTKIPLRRPAFKQAFLINQLFPNQTITAYELKKACRSASIEMTSSPKTYTPVEIRAIKLAMLAERKLVPNDKLKKPVIIPVRVAKGGTGKTTVTANVAAALAIMGYKVLCVDGDPQGSLTNLLGVDSLFDNSIIHIGNLIQECVPGTSRLTTARIRDAIVPIFPDGMLDLIPADVTLSQLDGFLMPQMGRELIVANLFGDHLDVFGQYDVIFMDAAPGTSYLALNLMAAGETILAPVSPNPESVKALELLTNNLSELNQHIHDKRFDFEIVVNGYDSRYKHCSEILDVLTRTYEGKINPNIIPQAAAFQREHQLIPTSSQGPVVERLSNSQPAKIMFQLTHSLMARFKITLGGIPETIIPNTQGRKETFIPANIVATDNGITT